VKTYRGNQAEATRLFQVDAAKLAKEGYFPISQSWADGSWDVEHLLSRYCFVFW
jgi:hypothetical protein